MKLYKNIFTQIAGVFIVCLLTVSCNDFLDQTPPSQISPELYLTEESQLAAYANNIYTDVLISHGNWSYGTHGLDEHTDNMAYINYSTRFVPGEWLTQQTEPSEKNDREWFFDRIYSCNYFLDQVLPRWRAGSISGTESGINYYIGEIYFLRAHEYFKRYQMFGDFPIIRNALPDEMAVLAEASERSPRNEVARFIIQDLDSALMLMGNTTVDSRKTRINQRAAQLLKSRVALFEGTWLKYFKGTAFVPNGNEWPGASKSYNANYQYPSGSIDNEIEYFLKIAMESAKQVADNVTLTANTGSVQQSTTDPVNPYMDMYGSEDLSGYDEVLMWREYSRGLGVVHCVVVGVQNGDYGRGITRGMVDGFLMENGLPIYANGSGYAGDDYISDVRQGRDPRLTLFLKEPDQLNVLYTDNTGDHAIPVEPYPAILEASAEKAYSTGYALRKGNSYYQIQCVNGSNYTGSITFRGVEAHLNYIEACYELNGTLDATAQNYWRAVRNRAGVDPDFAKTINATDMSEEAKNDWGAYSAGSLIDPTLYNIRRERRNELMAEGLRYMDIRRWRSMDQLITTPYHIEGFKLWGPMQDWYVDDKGNTQLVYGLDNSGANVSPPERSKYYRPYEKSSRSSVVNGYSWAMAHYLTPIRIQHIMVAADGGSVSDSPIYQNPYWPAAAGYPAEK